MKLYDSLFLQLNKLVDSMDCKISAYDKSNNWPENPDFQLILQKDMAFELGAAGTSAINYTLVTTDESLVGESQIVKIGKDLAELDKVKGYARISLVLVEEKAEIEEDTDKLYNMLQDIDFVKYHVFPKGYMLRTSGQSQREQVRIGREELKQGMTFEKIGNTFINHYMENKLVKAAKVIFITEDDVDYKALEQAAKQAADIKNSLSKISKGLPTECSECGIKEICNEVEGLRELHFGKKRESRSGNVKI